jgi:hypothetical protein
MLIAILSGAGEADEHGSQRIETVLRPTTHVYAMRQRRLDGSANRAVLREAMT